jgi:glycosyltransferase involved in cell wall biosynthesis
VTQSTPLVTIGIPTFNRSSKLGAAIRSALDQTHEKVEVLVSDNGSTDNTAAVVASFNDDRLRYVRQDTNRGMVANFNACLDGAKGEYFLMLSDDDTLHRNAVETLVSPLVNGVDGAPAQSIGISWSPTSIVDSVGKELWTSPAGKPLQSSIEMVIRCLNGIEVPRFCSYVMRVEDIRSVGGYQERYAPLCDSASWILVAARYSYAVCFQASLSRYTLHTASETSCTPISRQLEGGRNLINDLKRHYAMCGDTVVMARLEAVARNFYSSILASVILQKVGQPGWLRFAFQAAITWPKYTLTPYVLGRLITSMSKLLSLAARPEFQR